MSKKTKKNNAYLEKYYSDIPNKVLARRLKFSVSTIRTYGWKLGLKKSRGYRAKLCNKNMNKDNPNIWTKREKNILIRKYRTTPTALLIKEFGKKRKSINYQAEVLGLRKDKRYMFVNSWRPEEIQFLLDNRDIRKTSLEELGRKLGRNKNVVSQLRCRLKITNPKKAKHFYSETKPQRICVNILKEFGLKEKEDYEREFSVDSYYVDVFIKRCNLCIEVNGDYWHFNPRVYKGKSPDRIQMKGVKQDKIKQPYIRKKGYKLLILWEYDLENNREKCKKAIEKHLKKRGVEI